MRGLFSLAVIATEFVALIRRTSSQLAQEPELALATFRRRYDESGSGRSRLRSLIAPFLLRRLKSQVLSELPPRTEITLNVQLGPQERAL